MGAKSITPQPPSHAPARIDEIQRRPILVVESAPYGVVTIDRDRVADPHVFHGPADIADVLFKCELRCVDADHHQSLIFVFLGPGAHIRKRAQPVDAGVGPEIDENDFSAQSRRCQGRRIEPFVRALKRGQLGLASKLASRKPVKERNPYPCGCHRLPPHFPHKASNRCPECRREYRGYQ
ncbi:MAG: hypothetical protein QOI94_1429, partial [Acidobacteriaceae bacterium]|nr:hypothetical protein [Acidobacteriaceae bacterium]